MSAPASWPRSTRPRRSALALALALTLTAAAASALMVRIDPREFAPPLCDEDRSLAAAVDVIGAAPGEAGAVAALVHIGELLELLGAQKVHNALATLPAAATARLSPPARALHDALRREVDTRRAPRKATASGANAADADATVAAAAPAPPEWTLTGPYDGSDGAAFARVERFERDGRAPAPAVGRDSAVTQRAVSALDQLGEAVIHPAGSVVHLQRWVQVDRAVDVRIRLGALAEARLWIDGERALELPRLPAPRALSAVGEAVVRLAPGPHRLHLKLRDHDGQLAAALALDAGGVALAPRVAPAPPTGAEPPWDAAKARASEPPAWAQRWLAQANGRGRGGAKARRAALRGLAALDRVGWPWSTMGAAFEVGVGAALDAGAAVDSEVVLARAARARTAADREAIFAAALAAGVGPDSRRLRLEQIATLEQRDLSHHSDRLWRKHLRLAERESLRAHLLRVDLWLRLGGDLAARELAEASQLRFRDAVAAYELRARLCAAADDLHGAAEALRRAADLEPGHRPRQLAWLVALRATGRVPALVAAAAVVRTRLLDAAAGAEIVAHGLLDAGAAAAAAAELARLPTAAWRATTYELAARVAVATDAPAEAIAHLRAAMRLAPNRAELRARLRRLLPEATASEHAGVDALALARDVRDALRRARADARPGAAPPDLAAKLRTAWRKTRVVEVGAGRVERYEGEILVVGEGGPASHRVELDYVPGQTTAEVLRALVLRGDGRVVRGVETGLDRISEASWGLFYDLESLWLAFDDLQAGDVLLVETISRDVAADPFRVVYGDTFLLGDSRPVDRLELEVALRPGVPLHHRLAGPGSAALRVTVQTRADGGQTLRVVGRRLPAVAVEKAMPPAGELVPLLHVSSFPSWQAVAAHWAGLLRQSQPAPGSDKALTLLARELVAGSADEAEKIGRLTRFVADEIRYVGLEFGVHSLRPYPVAEVLARRFGDCKDKATLLSALLAEVGVAAEIALVRTTEGGRVDDGVASLSLFDHAIVWLPAQRMWIDATVRNHAPGELPEGDLGAQALRVPRERRPGAPAPTPETIALPTPADNSVDELLWIGLRASGEAEISMTRRYEGLAAAAAREVLAIAATRREQVQRELGARFPGVRIDAVEVEGAAGPVARSALTLRVKGVVPGLARREGARLLLTPLQRASLRDALADAERRIHPRLLGPPRLERSRVVVEGPKRWQASLLPQARTVSGPLALHLAVERRDGGAIALDATLRRERDRVAAAGWAAFRADLGAIDAALAQPLAFAAPTNDAANDAPADDAPANDAPAGATP